MAPIAAIGLRLHCGWASAVLIAQDPGQVPGLIARERIMLCELPHSKQPYHAAESMELPEAEAFIARCRAATIGLAVQAFDRLRDRTGARRLMGAGLASSSLRNLPPLCGILRSHPLIHAAEGMFYRQALIEAAAQVGIKAHAITSRVASDFLSGSAALKLNTVLDRMGKALGPPWTLDEKCASLVALSLLPDLAREFHLGKLDQAVR